MSGKKDKNKRVAAQPQPAAATDVAVKNTAPPPKKNVPERRPATSPAEITALKAEALVWMLTIISSLIVYIIVANIIHAVYHPDIDVLKQEAARLLVEPGAVRPEPVESMLFRTGVVVILLCLLGFYRLFSHMKAVKEQAAGRLFTVLAFACVAVLAIMIYADFAATNPYAEGTGEMVQNARDFHRDASGEVWGMSNFDFFFHGIFLGNYLLLYTFILVPLIACIFFFGVKKNNWGYNKPVKTAVSIICGLLILLIIAINTFNFPYSYENKYDFNAVFYSMTQVYAGQPLLVNGFTNTYGLYPEFLNPLFKITGLSVLSFSAVMSLLTGLSFLFNYAVLYRFTANKLLVLAGFMTVVFFPYLDPKFVTSFDAYFAMYPVRYIIPSTLAFFAGLYFQKGTRELYWTTFAIMGCAILWNPEIGMVCYLSWLAANIYHDFFDTEGRVAVKKILLHCIIAVAVAVTAALMYKGIIYAVYGTFPDLSLLFNTVTVFGKLGFNMLPMVLVHPWNLSVVVLITGFTYAVSSWYKKEKSAKASMVFLLSLLGVGYFVYFQGRSHNWSYSSSTSYMVMLLVILGGELWEKAKNANLMPLNALFAVFLFLISFSFFEVAYGAGKISELVSQDDDKSKYADEQARIESNIDFIEKNTREKEKIFVFSAKQYEGLYFGGSKRISAFNPGFMELFLKTDPERLTNMVAGSTAKIFVEPGLFNYAYMVRPFAAMAATYEVNGVNRTMAMLEKRTNKIPAETFFGSADMVVHEKYTDDTAGIHARINDALGMKVVSLNPSFAVEALFQSTKQVYQYATVVGNMDDTTGFIIANILNTPNYLIGVNGKGFGVPVPQGQWVYCVMNVFPDRVDAYIDGALVNSYALTAPMRQSVESLSIGNLGYLRYYVGAIAEVAVLNKPLDKAEVATTWSAISSAVNKK